MKLNHINAYEAQLIECVSNKWFHKFFFRVTKLHINLLYFITHMNSEPIHFVKEYSGIDSLKP